MRWLKSKRERKECALLRLKIDLQKREIMIANETNPNKSAEHEEKISELRAKIALLEKNLDLHSSEHEFDLGNPNYN